MTPRSIPDSGYCVAAVSADRVPRQLVGQSLELSGAVRDLFFDAPQYLLCAGDPRRGDDVAHKHRRFGGDVGSVCGIDQALCGTALR